MKKAIIFLVSFFLLMIDCQALDIESDYAVLYNLNDESVIFSKNKDVVVSVASLTKIMTVLVAIESIDDYSSEVILQEEIFSGLKGTGAYVIGLRPQQKVTYNDLLYGTFLASGADAAVALGVSVAGSEENFVKLMNNKVEEIGLSNTHFENTVGLDAEGHYSTVNSVALLLRYAFNNEKFKEIFMADKYIFSDGKTTVWNSMKKAASINKKNVDFIVGAKTGYTGNAGRCLASIAYDSDNDIFYLLVTTKAPTVLAPINDALTVYEYYFKNYKYQSLVSEGEVVKSFETRFLKEKSVRGYVPKMIKKYLPNDFDKNNIKFKYKGENTVTNNFKKNQKLGIIEVYYAGNLIDTSDVLLLDEIHFSLGAFLLYYKFYIIMFLLMCFFILIVAFKKKKKRLKIS